MLLMDFRGKQASNKLPLLFLYVEMLEERLREIF